MSEHDEHCVRGGEWAGYPDPADPDHFWICDTCGCRVPVAAVDGLLEGMLDRPPPPSL